MMGCFTRSLALCLLAALIGSGMGETIYPDYCTTFEEKPGQCIYYKKCPPIQQIVDKMSKRIELTDRENITFSQSGCSVTRPRYVCCEDDINATGLEMLKNETECGKVLTPKVTNGREVMIGSRPWMALLKYNTIEKGRYEFSCGGTLISKRFVLTAAHCMNQGDPVAVRLGEHSIAMEEDCVMVGSQTRCLPPHQDIGIENIFRHERYQPIAKQNDIALIKLDRDVVYSTHIKPICLPLNQQIQELVRAQFTYVVTGWGRTDKGVLSDVPLEAYVKLLPLQDCKEAYSENTTITQNQVCISAEKRDSCNGDSGGPLHTQFSFDGPKRFVQVGIVSFGAAQCGVGHYPSVYTEVAAFLPWIMKKIAEQA